MPASQPDPRNGRTNRNPENRNPKSKIHASKPETPTPVSTADGVDTLYSQQYRQTYHSRNGALIEARHVFLEGAGVAKHLAHRPQTCVLEVGFGTGLNFLLTARQADSSGGTLHYVALEKEVLPAAVLAQLNHGVQLDVAALHETLLAWRQTLPAIVPPGTYALAPSSSLVFTLIVGDASTVNVPPLCYDAVYLDAFSPDANPELWSTAFLARLFDVTRPGGVLATYSARGSVRRALETAGYRVEKRPGPPGKREMVVATRPA